MSAIVSSVSRALTANGGIFNRICIMDDPLHRFFVQAIFIIVICRGLALVCYPLKQPQVIWEIIGGIMLGPSAFGRNEYYLQIMFPPKTLANLSLVSNIGLTLYLFIVGMELDPKLLMSHARKAGGIALIGMAVPFALGIAISHTLYTKLESHEPGFEHVPARSFYIFIGTAMSITAFPVLARILKESGLIYTRPGSVAMGAAALNDAVAWCLLILAISIAHATDMGVAGKVFGCVFGFGIGLYLFVRIPFEKFVNYVESLNNKALDSHLFAFTVCCVFLSAWTTGLLGVDTIFGAFMFGLIVPRNTRLFHNCNEYIESFVLTITLPLYFALSGLKTDVTQIHTDIDGGMLILVCTIASFGKFIGAGFSALATGMTVRESATIAALMNTRGLVELIVLNLGLKAKILNVRTFTVMVLMALFTTFCTCPLIAIIYPKKYHTRMVDEELPKNDQFEAVASSDADESISTEKLIQRVSRNTRVALIVDRLDQLQSLINVISCFLPYQADSGLAVTAVHVIEPTKTKQDEFLALNEEGRLIRIDEETTDMVVALRDAQDPALKKPDLLPLSMFCKGMKTPVNAFRIQGDPDEFPLEIKNLSRYNECSMVLLPWRESVFVQKLFWTTLSLHSSAPVGLIVNCGGDGAARARSNSGAGAPAGRGRSGTLSEATTTAVNTAKHMFQSLFADPEAGPDAHQQEGIQLYSSVVAPSDRRPSMVNTVPKLPSSIKSNTLMVAVISGCSSDAALLATVMRFAENPSNSIKCLVAKDHESFDSQVVSAIRAVKTLTDSCPNVLLRVVESISTDTRGLIGTALEYSGMDYFLCGFVEPFVIATAAAVPNAPAASTVAPADNSSEEDSEEAREGVPRRYQGTHLKHPELGELGSRFLKTSTSSASAVKPCKMLVIHHGTGHQDGKRRPSETMPVTRAVLVKDPISQV